MEANQDNERDHQREGFARRAEDRQGRRQEIMADKKPKPLPPAGNWPVGNKLTGPLRVGTHHLPGMPSITVTFTCPQGFLPRAEFEEMMKQRKRGLRKPKKETKETDDE
jgi:hypothetical protein